MMGEDVLEKRPPVEQKVSVIDLSKRARQRLRSRRFSEARELFGAGLALEPENPYLLSGMGDVCRELKDFQGARDCYGKLLDIDANNLFALRGLGDVYKKLDRHQDAIELWSRYLVLRPQDKHVMTRIADSYKSLQRFDLAEQVYLDILAIASRDRYALTGLADLQHRMSKDEQAISTYERVLAFDENELHILTIVGKLCWRIGDFVRAERYFRRALKVDPRNPYALYGLGNCYRWNRQYDKAIEVWREILKTSDGTPALHTRMADACYNLDRKDEAEASYLRSLTFGADPYSIAGLICLLSGLGSWERALAYFWQLMELDGHALSNLELLTKRYVRAGEREVMLELFRRLISTGSLKGEILSEIEGHLGVFS
jgi:tetratricopeptide (TPR) repeat protein